MPSVCLQLQMHQPLRLRRYSVFDTEATYFDDELNRKVLRRVAERCYEPAGRAVLDLIRRHEGRFRVTFGVTGVLMEQLRRHAPEVVELLVELGETGFVEFVAEPYYHSLAFLYSREEFADQVRQQAGMIEDVFGQRPVVFRNAELIYNNDLASFVASLGGYEAVLSEGADGVLAGRSPNEVYRPPHAEGLALMLRNYRLSDDIGYRFGDRDWPEWPLTPEKFAEKIDRINDDDGRVANIFLDFETFGEHHEADTGIFDFLHAFPAAVLSSRENHFRTISEAVEAYPARDTVEVPHMISWADTERDLSAWLGNAMQSNALHELYKLERAVKERGDGDLLRDWRRLTVCDHFYYMSTKYMSDGAVHSYFNPYDSPYDSYINFMNVLDNLRTRLGL